VACDDGDRDREASRPRTVSSHSGRRDPLEWIKLRSLRSTWYSLLAALLIIDGLDTLFSGLHAHRMEQGVGPDRPFLFGFDATQISLRGVFLAQLAIGVLGVLVITGEYSTGMIRSSLGAVPHRQPVLFAKALVFAVVVLVVSLIATLMGFLFGQQAQASTHAQATLSTPGALLVRRRQVPTAQRRKPGHHHRQPRLEPPRAVDRNRRHRPLRTHRATRWCRHPQTSRRLRADDHPKGSANAGPCSTWHIRPDLRGLGRSVTADSEPRYPARLAM